MPSAGGRGRRPEAVRLEAVRPEAGAASSADQRPVLDRLLQRGTVAAALVLPLSFGLPVALRALWVYAVVALLGLAVVLGRAALPSTPLWLVAPVLALLGAVGAAAEAVDARGHWVAAGYFLVLWGPAPLVVLRLARSGCLPAAARALVVGQTVSSLAALYQGFSGAPVLGAVLENGRATGLAGHTNVLGLMGSVAVVLCLDAVLRTGSRRRLLVPLALVNVLAVLVSGSVTSVVALLAGCATVLLARRVRPAAILAALAVTCLTFFVVVQVADATDQFRSPLDRIAQTTGQTGEVSTFEIRKQTWHFAWTEVERGPWLGDGLDDASGVTFDQVTLTHNLPLRCWFQGGVALLLAVVLVLLSGLRRAVRAVRTRSAPAAAAVLVTLVAFAMTSATFTQPYFWLVFLAAWCTMPEPERARARHGRAARR